MNVPLPYMLRALQICAAQRLAASVTQGPPPTAWTRIVTSAHQVRDCRALLHEYLVLWVRVGLLLLCQSAEYCRPEHLEL